MRLMKSALLLVVLAPLFVLNASATQTNVVPDLEREQRLADQIVDGILDGEPVWLDDVVADRQFLAIYAEAEADTKGTVVLMHGRGMHPDWADGVGPLRVSLTEEGWNTLSIQMPVLAKNTKYYDYVSVFPTAFPRIDAAIKFARAGGAERVVLFAHSCSVHMSMAYVEEYGDSSFDGYIGAGMGATDYKQPMRKAFPFKSMSVPILDISGEDEFPAVLKGADARLKAFEVRHASSRQIVVPSTGHYFKGAEEQLGAAVSTWLGELDWARGVQ